MKVNKWKNENDYEDDTKLEQENKGCIIAKDTKSTMKIEMKYTGKARTRSAFLDTKLRAIIDSKYH